MKKFTESILMDKENPYSEKIRQEIENVDIEIIVENDLLSHDVLNSMEQMNLLFCLQYKLLIEKDNKKLAYLNYLISYYIFVILTPPFSEEIALKYAKDAINLYDHKKYLEWIEYVKQGNWKN